MDDENEFKSELSVGGVIILRTNRDKPNVWIRFWYRILLDWHWRDINE